jgi:hypothetical protein
MDGHEAGRQRNRGHSHSKRRILALTVVSGLVPLALSLVLSIKSALGYHDLLHNPGFEEGTSGWEESSGATFVTVTEPIASGDWAASLHQGEPPGELYISQDVTVVAGATYTLTGRAFKNEPLFLRVCLRIEWPGSTALPLEDCFAGNQDFYRPITVGPTLAPPDATQARIKAVAEMLAANPRNPVYFDELSLTSSMMPRGFFPLSLKNSPR